MQPLFLVFLDILFTSYTTHGYYLSLSIFEWKNASTYCQDYCNSHLASIHSQQQHVESIQLIERNPYIYKDVWIGLNDIHTPDDWIWSDSTPLDFGGEKDADNYIISGSWPWRNGEPDHNTADDCIVMDTSSNNYWSDREQVSNYHFLCNSCSGKLVKYAAINGFNTYSQASNQCKERFGTSLASIHSTRDMEEARDSCRAITTGSGCWIGLNDKQNRHNYRWDDGTEWDFGTTFKEYPWYYTQPGISGNQYCIQIDPDPEDYLWDDSHCNSTARTICNAPSEVCIESQFFISNEAELIDTWIWTKKPCEVSNELMQTMSVAIMGNKQYYNKDGILFIEMMFTMNKVGTNGNAGIAIYLDETNCNDHYSVGIWGNASFVYLGKFVDNDWRLIEYKYIGFVYNITTYYALQIELIDGILWHIKINDVSMFVVEDDEFNNNGNRLSGYVGIRNSNTSLSVKSLYISGDVQYTESNLLYLSCNNISTPTPTTDPTLYPTPTPTRIVYEIRADTTTTSTTTAEVVGDGGSKGPEASISQMLNNFQLFWIIGVPAGCLLVCACISWCINKYICDSGYDELGGTLEGTNAPRYNVNV